MLRLLHGIFPLWILLLLNSLLLSTVDLDPQYICMVHYCIVLCDITSLYLRNYSRVLTSSFFLRTKEEEEKEKKEEKEKEEEEERVVKDVK